MTPPPYLGLSWQTAAASGCGWTLRQSLLLLCTTIQTPEGPQTRNCEEEGWIGNGPSWQSPTLLLLSSALYSRWASTILSTAYLCSCVKPLEETWRGEVSESA